LKFWPRPKSLSGSILLPGSTAWHVTGRSPGCVQNAAAKNGKRSLRLNSKQGRGIAWNDIYGCIDEAIAELPDKLRIPVVAHFLDDQTHSAIALTLGISRRTVTDRIDSGVELLRKALKNRGMAMTGAALPDSSGQCHRSGAIHAYHESGQTRPERGELWGGSYSSDGRGEDICGILGNQGDYGRYRSCPRSRTRLSASRAKSPCSSAASSASNCLQQGPCGQRSGCASRTPIQPVLRISELEQSADKGPRRPFLRVGPRYRFGRQRYSRRHCQGRSAPGETRTEGKPGRLCSIRPAGWHVSDNGRSGLWRGSRYGFGQGIRCARRRSRRIVSSLQVLGFSRGRRTQRWDRLHPEQSRWSCNGTCC